MKVKARPEPAGVPRPIDRLALAMIYLATGMLPKGDEMKTLAEEVGMEWEGDTNGPNR